MKKLISLLLCVMMIVSMTACKAPVADAPAADAPATDAPAADAPAADAPATDTPAADVAATEMLKLPISEGSADKIRDCWFLSGLITGQALFSRTLSIDQDNTVFIDEDSLAESYTVSDDYMTYEFIIKDGIKWHDGEPLTAADIKYSIEYSVQTSILNSLIATTFNAIEGADELLAGTDDEMSGIIVDGNKLTIKLAEPTGYMLFSMGQFNILPKHHLEQYDPVTFNTSDFWVWPVGCGPYKMKEFKANDYGILELNTEYHGNMAEIPLVRMGYYTDADYVTLAQSNNIDYFYTMNVDVANEIGKLENYTVQDVPVMFNYMFFWNSYGRGGNGDDPIADVNVRKAILHAIDRQAIVDGVLGGYGLVHDSLVTASDINYNDDVYEYTYDPELAKSMLEEAGFDFNRTIRIATYYEDQLSANILDAFVYYLGEAGIKAEWFNITGDLVAGIYEIRDYELLYGAHSALTPIEVYNNLHSEVGGFISNLFPTTPNVMDDLIEQCRSNGDPAQQASIVKDLQAKESEMLHYMPLWTQSEFIVTNNRIDGEIGYGNELANYDRGLQDWKLVG